ncbi:tail fiber protein [Ancylomarina sp. DW003]|nr:tail fiber protein [Ancylomarina sp. DW003]MDE5421361.1 tail fiber protein [Ancylomarina sp. DW003]
MEAFLSFIALWPLKWAPRAWALCWGATISVNDNSALFSLIGATYGGNGTTTFMLPDFRGRVPVGYGQGKGLSPNQMGWVGGFEQVRLNQNQLPAHKHEAALSAVSVEFKASASAGTESIPGTNSATTFGATKDGFNAGDTLYNSDTPTVDMSGIAINGGSVEVQNTGQNQYHENRQPYLVTNYIICLQGIYPTRS